MVELDLLLKQQKKIQAQLFHLLITFTTFSLPHFVEKTFKIKLKLFATSIHLSLFEHSDGYFPSEEMRLVSCEMIRY